MTFKNFCPGKKEDKPQKEAAAKPAQQDGKGKEGGEAKKEGGKKVSCVCVCVRARVCVGLCV
jgi:hypothetical protein